MPPGLVVVAIILSMTSRLSDTATASAHLEAGRYPEAERAYRQILAERAASEPWNALGIVLRQDKVDSRKQSSAFRRAIQMQNDFLPAYQNLGRCCQLQEHFSQAEQVYRAMIQLWPRNAEAHDQLGWMLREQKQSQSAIPFLQTAVRLQPGNVDLHFHLGLLFNDAYDLNGAEHVLRDALAIKPDHLPAQRELAVVLWRQNQFDTALKMYDDILARDPENVDGRNGRAELLLLMGDYERGWLDYEWRWQDKKIQRNISF